MTDKRRESSPRDDIATLVRLADPSPISAERTERVRAAAHAEWRAQLARRRHRRYGVAAALAAAAALVAFVWSQRELAIPAAATVRVELVLGDVRVMQRGELKPGDVLRVGDQLMTADEGRVALRLGSGHSLRVAGATRLRLLEMAVLIDHGTLYVDSGGTAPSAQPITVQTPFGQVTETGTQYEVHASSAGLRVRLREGQVEVRHEGGVLTVPAGTELELPRDGLPRTRALSAAGTEWSWVAAVTPMLELEGRSAREFLDWAAREGGQVLRFSDDRLAREVSEIALDGGIEGLTLAQSLDAVLPACRLTHRVEGHVLHVARDR